MSADVFDEDIEYDGVEVEEDELYFDDDEDDEDDGYIEEEYFDDDEDVEEPNELHSSDSEEEEPSVEVVDDLAVPGELLEAIDNAPEDMPLDGIAVESEDSRAFFLIEGEDDGSVSCLAGVLSGSESDGSLVFTAEGYGESFDGDYPVRSLLSFEDVVLHGFGGAGADSDVPADTSAQESEPVSVRAGGSFSAQLGVDFTSLTVVHGLHADPNSISTPKYIAKGRSETIKGLDGAVKDLSVIYPLVVRRTEVYQEYLDSGSEGLFTGGYKYVLVDGLRRLASAVKLGVTDVPITVLEFGDSNIAPEASMVLSRVLNRHIRNSWSEIWGMSQAVNAVMAVAPVLMEQLLNLEPGEYLKMVEVISEPEFTDPKDQLMNGTFTLDKAYKELQKLRKEADLLEIENAQGVSAYGEAGSAVAGDVTEGGAVLSDAQVSDILELADGDVPVASSQEEAQQFAEFSADSMVGFGGEGKLQSTAERERLPKELRIAVLRRDNYECWACKHGIGISSSVADGTFEVHHTVGVYNQLESSRDDMGMISEGSDIPKLLTLCSRCHSQVHLLVEFSHAVARPRLKEDPKYKTRISMGITQEDWDSMPEFKQEEWGRLGRLATVLLEAELISGKVTRSVARGEVSAFTREPKLPYWEARAENDDTGISQELTDSLVDKVGTPEQVYGERVESVSADDSDVEDDGYVEDGDYIDDDDAEDYDYADDEE